MFRTTAIVLCLWLWACSDAPAPGDSQLPDQGQLMFVDSGADGAQPDQMVLGDVLASDVGAIDGQDDDAVANDAQGDGVAFDAGQADFPPGDCNDGVINQNETDVDCGGVCGPCTPGLGCFTANDCTTGHCTGTCSYAMNCADLLAKGNTTSGSYQISCSGLPADELTVNCDMVTAGGGWTEITIDMARLELAGQMVAEDAANIAEFDGSNRPRTRDGSGDHTYHYSFDVPCGFGQFLLRNYRMRAYAKSGQVSDISGANFVQSVWTLAHSSAYGDVSFGAASEAGPVTSFAAQVGTVSCQNCVTDWPDETVFSLSGSASQFRIGWGEGGGQEEGWYPWWSGSILVR